MSTQVAETGPCKRRISVSIPPAEVKAAMDNAWREAQQHVQLKGFRPGKVPRKVLEKKYGKSILEDVKQHLVNQAFRDALTEHELSPVDTPQLDLEQLELDPQQAFEFELDFEVRPNFEVPDYKGIEVGAPVAETKDEDIDRELEKLRQRMASLEEIEEGVVAKGDYLKVEVTYQVDGAEVIHHENAVVDTERGVVDNVSTEAATTAFAGKAKGAVVSVPAHLPEGFEPSGFAGAEATLLCTIQEIRRVTPPELDDQFAKKFEVDDVAALRDKLKIDYQRHVEQQRDSYIEERLIDELIKQTSFDLPEDLLNRATHQAVHELEHRMQQSGMDEAQAKAEAATHTDRVREDQSRSLRASFLIDRIAQKENLSVQDNELEQSIRALAASQGVSPQDLYDDLVENGRIGSLQAQILESKVRRVLRESAKVTDAKPESTES